MGTPPDQKLRRRPTFSLGRRSALMLLTAGLGTSLTFGAATRAMAGLVTAQRETKPDGLSGSLASDHPGSFDSRAQVAATVIPAPVRQLRVAGYHARGDGFDGLYVRVAAEPPHALWVRSADGAYWEYVPGVAGYNGKAGGAVGDGSADDHAALQAVLDALPDGATVIIPEGEYGTSRFLEVAASNVTIVAYGARIDATLTGTTAFSATPGISPVIRLLGDGCRILGGTWREIGGEASSWQLEVRGANCRAEDAAFAKTANPGGGSSYQAYVRHGADGFTMVGCRTSGADGVFCEASDVLFLGNEFVGEEVGGDDAIALKAIQGVTRNIRIIGNSFRNLAYGVSVGSEVGVLGANDATRARRVSTVVFQGNTLEACTGFAFLKPGSVEIYDYRDGMVEDFVISDNVLTDLEGLKFTRALALTPARGARIRNIKGANNIVRARCRNTSGRRAGVDFYNIDYSGVSAGIGEPDISDVHVGVEFIDPYEGKPGGVLKLAFSSGGTHEVVAGSTVTGATSAATGVVGKVVLLSGSWAGGDAAGYLLLTEQTGTFQAENLNVGANGDAATISGDSTAVAPSDAEYARGHPVNYIASIENATAAHGTMSDIVLDVKGNGAQHLGILIGAGLDGAVEVRRAHLEHASVAPSSSIAGGIYALSDVQLGDIRITSLANGHPVGAPAITGTTYTAKEETVPVGSYGAGTDVEKPVWIAPRDCYVHSVLLTDGAGLSLDATNYTTLEFVNKNTGAAIVSRNTTDFSLAANTATRAHRDACMVAPDAFDIPRGTVVTFRKTDSGAGAAITEMIATIRYVEHGA